MMCGFSKTLNYAEIKKTLCLIFAENWNTISLKSLKARVGKSNFGYILARLT